MNAAGKLHDLGILGISDMVKKLELYGSKKEIFEAWMEWRKERDIEQGILEGKSLIQSGIKELLNIDQ